MSKTLRAMAPATKKGKGGVRGSRAGRALSQTAPAAARRDERGGLLSSGGGARFQAEGNRQSNWAKSRDSSSSHRPRTEAGSGRGHAPAVEEGGWMGLGSRGGWGTAGGGQGISLPPSVHPRGFVMPVDVLGGAGFEDSADQMRLASSLSGALASRGQLARSGGATGGDDMDSDSSGEFEGGGAMMGAAVGGSRGFGGGGAQYKGRRVQRAGRRGARAASAI